MFVIKFLSLFLLYCSYTQDSELPDDRQHCCSIQTGGRDFICLSLDSRADLLHLEKAWYRASNTAVKRLVVNQH